MKNTKNPITQNELNSICQVCGDYGKNICTLCPIEQLRQKIVVRTMKNYQLELETKVN